MNRSDQLNIHTPAAEDNSRDTRHVRMPSCVTSALASVMSVFCIGLVSGAAGGLLLGATAVVGLQALELLADNRLLMGQLENCTFITYNYDYNSVYVQCENNHRVLVSHIFTFVAMFAVISSSVSLPVGVYIGLSTYSLVIKKKGEAAMGKALALAGTVCLMGVTATGCLLGIALESLLSIMLNSSIYVWVIISVGSVLPFTLIFSYLDRYLQIFVPIYVAGVSFITFILSTVYGKRLISLTPIILILGAFGKSYFLQLNALSMPLMLLMSDVYTFAGQRIVELQSSTLTINVVLEAIFLAILASQLLTVVVGMSLCESWQTGGAGRICATAAGSGTAVLGAIKFALPTLGPGPTIGALVGVAGAVGVSLSAAMAATNQYGQVVERYGFVGRLGVIVGAAVGAFLSSCAHSGLSKMFMCLCAATIPGGPFLKLLLLRLIMKFSVCYCLWILVLVLLSLTFTGFFQMLLKDLLVVVIMPHILVPHVCVLCFD